METAGISCPISAEHMDRNAARVSALFPVLLAPASLYTGSFEIMAVLAADFALRAFTSGKLSPVGFLSRQIIRLTGIKPVMIDRAPRRFAAGVGMIFSAATAVLIFLQFGMAAYVVGSILLLCAVLESVFGVCVGCIVYSLLKKYF